MSQGGPLGHGLPCVAPLCELPLESPGCTGATLWFRATGSCCGLRYGYVMRGHVMAAVPASREHTRLRFLQLLESPSSLFACTCLPWVQQAVWTARQLASRTGSARQRVTCLPWVQQAVWTARQLASRTGSVRQRVYRSLPFRQLHCKVSFLIFLTPLSIGPDLLRAPKLKPAGWALFLISGACGPLWSSLQL